MFSADQAHLRRYLTTLGVAVTAGTLSLAGLFLKLQEDLLVTNSTLSQVTPTARAALLERQRYLAFGTSILPYFVLVGFLGGLSLFAYGLMGWAKRQKVTDALEDLALSRGQVEFSQMTVEEQAEELTREAKESAADIARSGASAEGGDTVASQQLVSTIRDKAVILESSLFEKLQTALGEDVVQTNIRVSGSAGRATIDALARLGKQTIVLELKYLANPKNAAPRIDRAFVQADLGVRAVAESGAPNVQGIIIFITPTSANEDDIRKIAKYIVDLQASFVIFYQVILMKYSDFISLSPQALVGRFHGI
jgi:hypothetical protein